MFHRSLNIPIQFVACLGDFVSPITSTYDEACNFFRKGLERKLPLTKRDRTLENAEDAGESARGVVRSFGVDKLPGDDVPSRTRYGYAALLRLLRSAGCISLFSSRKNPDSRGGVHVCVYVF